MSDVWPRYNLGSRDHLHAIGTLVSAWNLVETAYQLLVDFIIDKDARLGAKVFDLLGNETRWALISGECDHAFTPWDAENVRHFLKCSAICKENRNAVAHAQTLPDTNPALISLRKGRKPDSIFADRKDYLFSLETLREMADETYAIAAFGEWTWYFAMAEKLSMPTVARAFHEKTASAT